MHDTDPARQPDLVPGGPPPPPRINARRTWITLLAPSAAMAVMMLLMLLAKNRWGRDETFIMVSCVFSCLVAALSWGFFIQTMARRFRGTSLVLLILAYPLLQAVLLIATFFAGCLAILSIHGY